MRNTKGRPPIYKWRSLGEQEGGYDGKRRHMMWLGY